MYNVFWDFVRALKITDDVIELENLDNFFSLLIQINDTYQLFVADTEKIAATLYFKKEVHRLYFLQPRLKRKSEIKFFCETVKKSPH